MRNFLKGKKMWGYVSGTYVIPKNIEECWFDRYMGSKQCKYYYLDQQFCLAFHRYAVREVLDNKGGLGSSTKVIYAIKFCKAVSVRE